jgi:hypothetical protein
VRDNPNDSRFCDAIPPFRTTVKASGAYTFPADVQLSGTFYSIPGSDVAATYTVTSAVAGRPIIANTAGSSTTTVNLAQPGTVFLDYQNRLDLRLGKMFRLNNTRIQGFMDIFNVFNAGTVTRVNTNYSPATATTANPWLTPTSIIDARYFRFGMQLNF